MKRSAKSKWVRASVSFPADIYQNLKGVAKQKKVSLAWVVREAAEKYIAGQAAEVRRQGFNEETRA